MQSPRDQLRNGNDQPKKPLDPVTEDSLTPFSSGLAILEKSTEQPNIQENLPAASVASVRPKVRERSGEKKNKKHFFLSEKVKMALV